MKGAMLLDQAVGTIRVAELKTKSMPYALDRLDEARRAGKPHLEVLNRGRPILHLGLPEEVPERWRSDQTQSVPYVDLRRGRVSLLGLRQKGGVVLLTQRRGPSLALWPLEEDFERPPALTVPERLDYLEREVRRLRRQVAKFDQIFDRIHGAIEGRGQPRKEGQQTMFAEANDSEEDHEPEA
jgi:hypothetical protein